ncbi:MAG: (2Fe-2S)-binding protein, partial [Pirellulales bacterium]
DPLRIAGGAGRGRPVGFTFDGQNVQAFDGETIAAALLAAGLRALRTTARRREPRGVFCNMGACFDCLVQVDGRRNVQACLTPVREGMRVETQQIEGDWIEPT